jgi:hypothetical protein
VSPLAGAVFILNGDRRRNLVFVEAFKDAAVGVIGRIQFCPLLKLDEFFDPEFAVADLLYSLFENAQDFNQLDWLADLCNSEAHVWFPETGDIALVADVEPKELVFDREIHEPGIIPLGRFGETLHLPLSRGGGGVGGLGCGFGSSGMSGLLSLVVLDVLRALIANCEWIGEMFGFDGDDCFGRPFAR